MNAPNDASAVLRDLEESLWREETRFDRAHMGVVLAPGFLEFGMSGRRYDRDAIITSMGTRPWTVAVAVPPRYRPAHRRALTVVRSAAPSPRTVPVRGG
jgi:hypothetical protein